MHAYTSHAHTFAIIFSITPYLRNSHTKCYGQLPHTHAVTHRSTCSLLTLTQSHIDHRSTGSLLTPMQSHIDLLLLLILTQSRIDLRAGCSHSSNHTSIDGQLAHTHAITHRSSIYGELAHTHAITSIYSLLILTQSRIDLRAACSHSRNHTSIYVQLAHIHAITQSRIDLRAACLYLRNHAITHRSTFSHTHAIAHRSTDRLLTLTQSQAIPRHIFLSIRAAARRYPRLYHKSPDNTLTPCGARTLQIPLLVHEILLLEVWREKVYPALRDMGFAAKSTMVPYIVVSPAQSVLASSYPHTFPSASCRQSCPAFPRHSAIPNALCARKVAAPPSPAYILL